MHFELQKWLILNRYSRGPFEVRQMLLELAAKFLWDRHRSCWGEPGTRFWWLSHPWRRISWNCTRFSTKDIKLFLPLTVTMNRCLLSEEIRRALPPSLNWWVVKHSLSSKTLQKSVYLFLWLCCYDLQKQVKVNIRRCVFSHWLTVFPPPKYPIW